MVKDRHAEYKMLEGMLEAMEQLPQVEGEIDRLNRERSEAEASRNSAVQQIAEYKEYVVSESAKLDAQLKDKQGEVGDAMDQLEENLKQKDMEYNNEIDVLEVSSENLRNSMVVEVTEMKEKHEKEMAELKGDVELMQAEKYEAQTKLKKAQEDLKDFLSKHAE